MPAVDLLAHSKRRSVHEVAEKYVERYLLKI